jgi:mannose-1-phosphate guanylyltransferase
MAGGKGTRFWPESTRHHPKQYLKLMSDKTLLEETCERFEQLVPVDQRFIVTVSEQKKLCTESASGKINSNGIILEPSGRNTAPCILLSLAYLLKNGATENDVLAIVPSDHVILNQSGFQNTLKKAFEFCVNENEIVTIGITPHFPHTGFGYIQKGELVNAEAFKVSRFKEKPHFELAKEYIKSGEYLWNAGMFVAPIKVLLEEFQKHAPEMFKYFGELKNCISDIDNLKSVYEKIPADSLDYAIMEKSSRVSVIPAQFDWNDLGSWDALASVINETHGNTVVKSDGQFFLNSTDNIIYAPDKFVSLINMEKHIIVVNDKVVLVAPIKDSQEVKKIVEGLKGVRDDLL